MQRQRLAPAPLRRLQATLVILGWTGRGHDPAVWLQVVTASLQAQWLAEAKPAVPPVTGPAPSCLPWRTFFLSFCGAGWAAGRGPAHHEPNLANKTTTQHFYIFGQRDTFGQGKSYPPF